MNLCQKIGHHMQQLTQLEGELEDMRKQVRNADEKALPKLRIGYQEVQDKVQELQETIKGLQWNIPAVWKRVFGINATKDKFIVNDEGYLETLDLENGSDQRIPPELQAKINHSEAFRYLPQLKTLNLGSWSRESLPRNIEHLTTLENLILSHAHIREIPGSVLRALSNLKKLSLLEMQNLAALPPEIATLNNLKEIAWCINVFQYDHPGIEVPEVLWKLPKLETVRLSRTANPIKVEAIRDQSNITWLHLVQVAFEGDRRLLCEGKCPKLRKLHFHEIKGDKASLEDLSSGFSSLLELKDFSWIRQDNLTGKMLAPLGQLASLTKFKLGGRLEGDFPNLQQSKDLKEMDLWGLELPAFPIEVFQATSLERLWFYNTNITDIPPQIKTLCRLKELNINGSPIKEVPETLGEILSLKELKLDNTQVNDIPEAIAKRVRNNGLKIIMNDTPFAKDVSRWRAFRKRYETDDDEPPHIYPNI